MLEQAEEIRHNLDNLLFNITFNKFRNIYLNIDSSENIHRTDLLMFILIIDWSSNNEHWSIINY